MGDFLFYTFLLALLAGGVGAAFWIVKSYLSGQSPTAALFRPRPERRLGVVEQANVDGRRKLILIRRDGVEHLILTGGPVDVVVETGIGETNSRRLEPAPASLSSGSPASPVFGRPVRAAIAPAAESL